MCGYVACVLECRGSVCCDSQCTLYDIPPIGFIFQGTQKDPRSSMMIAGYCRNMWEPVYRIKEMYRISAYCSSFLLRLIMHGMDIKLFMARFKLISVVGQALYWTRQVIEQPNPRIIRSLLIY
jgi:hypothetical protein